MRHSAITFAAQAKRLIDDDKRWDLLFCSDMLNLAEFTALAPRDLAGLPKVIYFHENQLTYPVRAEDERDCHFAMTNLTSALAADAVWLEAIEKIRLKSSVHPPGVDGFPPRRQRKPGPLRILWVARWEHDKNPEDFFEAMAILKARNVRFRLSVIGQSFRVQPEIFARARNDFKDLIDHWGYQESCEAYRLALCEADVIVSTANHEFFGIGLVEAVAAGAYPLVPERLSYPEILGLGRIAGAEQFFYDGTAADLSRKLSELAVRVKESTLWPATITPSILTDHLQWHDLARQYDKILAQIRR
jgi:glycosyltransferase involved in cell wall biosynthesis